ncbi:Complex I intermediate-associated protein 30 domain containing protein [Seminavis robusta]|uniref:Complex I intermediate-associated protein 30 domain containing protein n=1 Tax=Seminavis robusta TaxID=568900 RepID=A0A9N8DRK7_9STRA|nr:Complex I intermediate-associated protein 30 domain containing protein [Seminavis robusta]|eukprot:Sro301_g111990.1 Complex I intermediate-associated protein 30 domain containing protein (430) ;mRNA; r:49164-50453
MRRQQRKGEGKGPGLVGFLWTSLQLLMAYIFLSVVIGIKIRDPDPSLRGLQFAVFQAPQGTSNAMMSSCRNLVLILFVSTPIASGFSSPGASSVSLQSPSELISRSAGFGLAASANGDQDPINQDSTTRRDFATRITFAAALATSVSLPQFSLAADDATATNKPSTGPVTVIGANGRTGYECVKALQARSVSVRACTRTGEYRDGDSVKGVVSLACDVTDPSTIAPAVKGASAVIFAASASKEGGAPSSVDNAGLVSVAKACIDAQVKQLVIVSSGAVSKPSSPTFQFLNLFGKIMEEKIKGEDAVRALYAVGTPAEQAGLSYTVVRPGGLTEEPSLGSVALLELNQGDTKSGRIARADVANICVEALYYPELAGRTTFECYNADTAAPLASVGISNIFKQKTAEDIFVSGRECRGGNWKELFSGLEKD